MKHLEALAQVHQRVVSGACSNNDIGDSRAIGDSRSSRSTRQWLDPVFQRRRGPRRPEGLPVATKQPDTPSTSRRTSRPLAGAEDTSRASGQVPLESSFDRIWRRKSAQIAQLDNIRSELRQVEHRLDEARALYTKLQRQKDEARIWQLTEDVARIRQLLEQKERDMDFPSGTPGAPSSSND